MHRSPSARWRQVAVAVVDLEHPREVGYFNKPGSGGSSAMPQPA